MKASQLNALGTQLVYMFPSIYKSNIPTSLAVRYPMLQTLLSEKKLKGFVKTVDEQKSIIPIKSAKNVVFTSIVKSRRFGGDLYSEIVAKYLKSDLEVEVWRRGAKNLESSCKKPAVKNILELKIGAIAFPTTKDHSKWAVTVGKDRKSNAICIGDINRQESQFRRGGGTTCLESKVIRKLFKNTVNMVENCD
ncbi:hypothetical protein AB6A40_000851 [Gnathostoma spinigerum]|uniref:Uncharacterized protein n=1 Tax=Gnathostoma spinigerum TaxID=75299 RepID=A0ABD6E501_9BILA